jgi:hypothetical protein
MKIYGWAFFGCSGAGVHLINPMSTVSTHPKRRFFTVQAGLVVLARSSVRHTPADRPPSEPADPEPLTRSAAGGVPAPKTSETGAATAL